VDAVAAPEFDVGKIRKLKETRWNVFGTLLLNLRLVSKWMR
jgi:hypothetical protein